MKKQLIRKIGTALLSSCLTLGTAASFPAQTLVMAEESEASQVSGTVVRAPQEANLEAIGDLDWIHCSSKDQSAWAGAGKNVIGTVQMTGTLAQIMDDADTNYIYEGAPADNRKGQVINQIGGKSEFTLPARTEETYVSIFTGSWASQIKLSVLINGEEAYSNTHGKEDTTDGAESFLTQFHYHANAESDEIKVVIETVKVYSDYYGNHSLQAIALSDQPQKLTEEENGYVKGVLDSMPSRVNLTKQGALDWINFDSEDFGSFNRKNLAQSVLGEPELVGRNDYVTDNCPASFVYSDGYNPVYSADVNHKALVFTGAGNGMTLSLPGSQAEKCLDIYTGAWASDIEVTLSVNGEQQYSKTYGSSNTTAGSPAKYQALRLNYHTDSDDDTVQLGIRVAKVYDASWGNMNVAAITLSDERVQDDGSVIGCTAKAAPAAADLSEQGKTDWMYFDSTDLANLERKKLDAPVLGTPVLTGSKQDQLTTKAKTSFSWTDGTKQEQGENGHSGFVCLHAGSGIDVSLPASTSFQYVNVYAGAWAADAKAEVLVNGEVQYAYEFGSSDTTPDTTVYKALQIGYKTASADDQVTLRVQVSKAYDLTYGNINISAITLGDIPAASSESLSNEYWTVDHTGGEVSTLQTKIGDEMVNIPMRNDQYSGIGWMINGRRIALTQAASEGEQPVYTGRYRQNGADITVTLAYSLTDQGQFAIQASLVNNKDEDTPVDTASLRLGFNTYLESYPEYNDQLFPTLMRCEKTHAWGYFSSPSGKLMTFATDAPVASYTLDYQSGQHRIYSASLDVLQSGKLPERHPQGLNHLEANETKTWNIVFKPASSLNATDEIKPILGETTELPILDADKYTISENEKSTITIRSKTDLEGGKLTMTDPAGSESELSVSKVSEGIYQASFDGKGREHGQYKIHALNKKGYQSEMILSVRNEWSWYIQKARQAAVEAPQKGSSHAETFYGFYSAYVARKYYPDANLDAQIDDKFDECYALMYDLETGNPTSWENRIQNHSTTLGIFVDMYQSTGNKEALAKAEHLADFLMSKQKADGGYYNGGTDYTSVIYPAKSIMELTHVEKELMTTAKTQEERDYNKERYELHMDSLAKAMDKLVRVDGNFDTEGQGTYEDGANSCSIAQLSEFALMYEEGSAERKKYADSAEEYLRRHTSHEQALVPDSRMVGGTLRFWEAQYDVEMGLTSTAPNMMNSPHGWSAWNIYGLFNLYELTGNPEYLQRGMNAMGSCAQLMGYDGKLNWSFIADPQRVTRFFVKDEENSHDDVIVGKHETRTIGEEYVPMISYWWKAPKNTWVPGYTAMGGSVTQGACCDNDVHEVFKALGEVALTKAYVYEKEDGTFVAYNAVAEEKDGKLVITAEEDVISNVSVQLRNEKNVQAVLYDGVHEQTVAAGLPVWISTDENAVDLDNLDRDCTLRSLEVKGAEVDETFDPETLTYTVNLPKTGGTVTLKPTASSAKATVFIDGEAVSAGGREFTLTQAHEEKVVRITVRSENNSASRIYTVKIGAMGSDVVLDPSSMTATAGSQHAASGSEGPASNVLDGNANSIWHTKYNSATIPMEDRWIQLNLDKEQTVTGVRYLPRQAGSNNGMILSGKILVSNDKGTTWTEAASFEWPENTEWKMVSFDGIKADTVRIVPETTVGEFGSAAEIRVVADPGEADRTVLKQALDALDAQLSAGAFDDFLKEIKDYIQSVKADGQTVYAKENATQNQIDAAADKVKAAGDLADLADTCKALEGVIAQAKALDESKWTEESWTALETAVNAAEDVLKDPEALSQNVLAKAKDDLEKAIADLAKPVVLDDSLLKAAADKADALDLASYREAGKEELAACKAKAKALLEQIRNEETDTLTQAQIDAKAKELNKLLLELRLSPKKELL